MKYYFLPVILVIVASSAITFAPFLAKKAEGALISIQIPAVINTQEVKVEPVAQKIVQLPVSQGIVLPTLSANAVLVKDLETDTILYQKNVNIPVPIASTTKIMTALVGNEFFKPNSVLTVNEGAKIGGAVAGLQVGEVLNFRSVLYAMLLNSGNDAAFTIAENYPGGVASFVAAMNQKASDLSLRNTHFENPAGFDSESHYSSAADLAVITQEALKDGQLSRIFATKNTEVASLDKKHTHQLQNLNKLLTSVPGVLGVKTGYTELAKENLVTLVERDGHRVLTIVLGSDDRFGDSTKLIEWTFQNYQWK